jgi:hypothetical protein
MALSSGFEIGICAEISKNRKINALKIEFNF